MLKKVNEYKRLAVANSLLPKRRNEHRDRAEELRRHARVCANQRSLEERGQELVEPSQLLKNFLSRSPLARLLQTEEDTAKHLRTLQRYSQGKNRPFKLVKKGKPFSTTPWPRDLETQKKQALLRRRVSIQNVKRPGPQSASPPPKRPPQPQKPKEEPPVKVVLKPTTFKKETFVESIAKSYRQVFATRPADLTPTKSALVRTKPEKRHLPPSKPDANTRSKSDYALEALVRQKLWGNICSKPTLFTLKTLKPVEPPAPRKDTKDVFKERILSAVDISGKTTYQLLNEFCKEVREKNSTETRTKEEVNPQRPKELRNEFNTDSKSAYQFLIKNPKGAEVPHNESTKSVFKDKAKASDVPIKTCEEYLDKRPEDSASQPKHAPKEKFDIEASILETKQALQTINDTAKNTGDVPKIPPNWKEVTHEELLGRPTGTSVDRAPKSDSWKGFPESAKKQDGARKERIVQVWQPPKELDDPELSVGGKKFKDNVEKYFHKKNGGAIKLQEALKKERLSSQPKKEEKETLQPQIYPKTSLLMKATNLPLQLCQKIMQSQEKTPQPEYQMHDKKSENEVLPGLVCTVEDKTVNSENSGFFERITRFFTK